MSKRNLTLVGLVLPLVFAVILFISGCEPGGNPIVQNQSNNEIRIYVARVRIPDKPDQAVDYGPVPAQTTKELAGIAFIRYEHIYRIEAKDPTGKVVFSHDYNYYDLKKIGWKITIPP